jgi:hypothetical protein
MASLNPRADDRVRRHTSSAVNARIDKKTNATLERTAREGRDGIIVRLKELDREWDVNRALLANFAIVGAIAHELGRSHRGWRNVFRAQLGFLLLHAIAGWSPPLPIIRRLGFRTGKEIAAERAALMKQLHAHTSGAAA